MQVSMWMMHDALEKVVVKQHLNDLATRRCIGGVLPYVAEDGLTDDRLYIVDATQNDPFRIPDERCYLVVVGDCFEPPETHLCQYLVLDREEGLIRAIAAAEHAYQRYIAWYDRLNAELMRERDLNRLCEIAAELLDNPIMVYDRDYAVIGNNLFPNYPRFFEILDKQSSYYITKPEMLALLKAMPAFRKTFDTHGAQLFEASSPLPSASDIDSRVSLYVNFGFGQAYEGRVVISEFTHKIRRGDYQLAEIFCDVLRIALKQPSIRATGIGQVFRTYLVSLLEGTAADDRQLADSLRLWGWPRKGRFVCLRMSLAEGDSETASDLFICTKIELELPGSCAIRYDGDVVCVVPLAEGQAEEAVVGQLEKLLEGFAEHIGVSGEFDDIIEVDEYYREAAIALRMGARDVPDTRAHRFCDFALQHFFERGTSELSAIHFCDPDVKKLLAYRGGRKDYYTVLRTYLEQGLSQTKTSEVLYIHRTTLFNYLKEIQEIVDADLDDADARLRMLSSFEIMRMGEKGK